MKEIITMHVISAVFIISLVWLVGYFLPPQPWDPKELHERVTALEIEVRAIRLLENRK